MSNDLFNAWWEKNKNIIFNKLGNARPGYDYRGVMYNLFKKSFWKGGGNRMTDSTKVMESKIHLFNQLHPVGSDVAVVKDLGEMQKDVIKYPATIMGGHTAVAWLVKGGSYCLDRVF
jgi:hypothetical protein